MLHLFPTDVKCLIFEKLSGKDILNLIDAHNENYAKYTGKRYKKIWENKILKEFGVRNTVTYQGVVVDCGWDDPFTAYIHMRKLKYIVQMQIWELQQYFNDFCITHNINDMKRRLLLNLFDSRF